MMEETTVLHIITSYAQLDGQKLMAVYAESNLENTDCFFPDLTDKALAVLETCEKLICVTDFGTVNAENRRLLEAAKVSEKLCTLEELLRQ